MTNERRAVQIFGLPASRGTVPMLCALCNDGVILLLVPGQDEWIFAPAIPQPSEGEETL